jgi:hypothetical protein
LNLKDKHKVCLTILVLASAIALIGFGYPWACLGAMLGMYLSIIEK